jgi:hypothetical protein
MLRAGEQRGFLPVVDALRRASPFADRKHR